RPEEPGAARFEGLVRDFNVEQKRDAAALEAEFADLMRRHRPEADNAGVEPERAMRVVLKNIGHELGVAARYDVARRRPHEAQHHANPLAALRDDGESADLRDALRLDKVVNREIAVDRRQAVLLILFDWRVVAHPQHPHRLIATGRDEPRY